MTMTMDDMLEKLDDGWTVKAVYKTHTSDKITVEGVVRANQQTQWFQFATPEDGAPLPLCQMVGRLPHFLLIEVVSVTPPPVYTNTPDTEYQIGDEIQDVDGNRWTTVRNLHDTQGHPEADVVFLPTSGVVGSRAEEYVTRALVGPLKLVGRVQPWPVKGSYDEVEERFEIARYAMARQINDQMKHYAPTDVTFGELDRAKMVVEKYDFDDAYPRPDWD